MKKDVFIKITLEALYTFQDKSINGWTAEEVIEQWFRRYPIEKHHASRDAHQLGNSTIVINAQVLKPSDVMAQHQKIDEYYAELERNKRETKRLWEETMKQTYVDWPDLKDFKIIGG